MGGIPAALIDEQRSENEKAATDALARFEDAARRAGVSFDTRSATASLAGAADTFAAMARRFDLSVVAQSEPDKVAPEELIAEGALFGSGRPVVVVPYIQKAGFKLERVMVAWDASRNAARAIADAMPMLAKAKAIDIVIVASERPEERRGCGRRYRPAPSAPRPDGRRETHRRNRHRCGEHDPVACGRQRGRFPGDGRLRPFAAARIRPGRRNARHSRRR